MWMHFLLNCLECQLCVSRQWDARFIFFALWWGGIMAGEVTYWACLYSPKLAKQHCFLLYILSVFTNSDYNNEKNTSKSHNNKYIIVLVGAPCRRVKKQSLYLFMHEQKTVNADCLYFKLTVGSIGISAQYARDQRL